MTASQPALTAILAEVQADLRGAAAERSVARTHGNAGHHEWAASARRRQAVVLRRVVAALHRAATRAEADADEAELAADAAGPEVR